MISARPARSSSLVVHPCMTVSDLIHGTPKVWNLEMLENLVAHDDIPLICSFVISQFNKDEKYNLSYIKKLGCIQLN